MVTLFLTTEVMGVLSACSSLVLGIDQMLTKPAEQLLDFLYLVLSMVFEFMLVRLGLRLGEDVMQSCQVAARQI